MYSNYILNFQESTIILNACTKKSGNLLNAPCIHENASRSGALRIVLYFFKTINPICSVVFPGHDTKMHPEENFSSGTLRSEEYLFIAINLTSSLNRCYNLGMTRKCLWKRPQFLSSKECEVALYSH